MDLLLCYRPTNARGPQKLFITIVSVKICEIQFQFFLLFLWFHCYLHIHVRLLQHNYSDISGCPKKNASISDRASLGCYFASFLYNNSSQTKTLSYPLAMLSVLKTSWIKAHGVEKNSLDQSASKVFFLSAASSTSTYGDSSEDPGCLSAEMRGAFRGN